MGIVVICIRGRRREISKLQTISKHRNKECTKSNTACSARVNDERIVDKIRKYQKEQSLSSFVATVRKLCAVAIEIEKTKH